MMKHIYVYFACFHDSEVLPTIIDCYKTATLPQRIHMGIDFQYANEQIKNDFVNFVKAHPEYNISYKLTKYTNENLMDLIGLAKGRIRASSMRNEIDEYCLLIDGHTKFAPHWDSKLIKLHTQAEELCEKPILNGYAGNYVLTEKGRERVWLPHIMSTIRYQYYVEKNKDDLEQQIARFDWHDNLPTFSIAHENPPAPGLYPNVKFSGNFSFCKYNVTDYLPEWVLFEDEEIPWTVELYDAGFSLVFPSLKEPLIGHLYMGGESPWLHARETRDNIEEYVEDHTEFLKTKDNNINKWLHDPANKEKIENFERYAKVRLLEGELVEYYIPKNFR